MVLGKFRLDGKVAIVTGSGRGLGRAMALAFAEAGANVVVTARSADEIEETRRQVEASGAKGLAVQTDVSDENQVEALVDRTLQHFGTLDILVNNVGMAVVRDLLHTSLEDWKKQIDTNLTATFLCCRAAGRHMVERREGRIVNVSTVAGVRGKWQMTGYGAAKAGVLQLTRTLAVEWGRFNVRVNCIIPGIFHTSATRAVIENPKMLETRIRKVPMRRYGMPEEIAPLAVFLASDASSFITGVSIPVDGGEIAKL